LYIEKGVPAKTNEFRVSISIAKLSEVQTNYEVKYDFDLVGKMVISNLGDVAGVKKKICKFVNNKRSLKLSVKLIRLREVLITRLSTVMHSSQKMKLFNIYEKKNLAIEILKE